MSAAVTLAAAGFGLSAAAILGVFILVRLSLLDQRDAAMRARAELDLLLRQRQDELPRLADACAARLRREPQVLAALAEARAGLWAARSVRERANAEAHLSHALAHVLGAVARDPLSRLDRDLVALRARLAELVHAIEERRGLHDERAEAFNARLEHAPDAWVARASGLRAVERFAEPVAFACPPFEDGEDEDMARSA